MPKYMVQDAMPYLLLIAGIILATIGLFRFLRKAPQREIHLLFLSAAAIGVAIAALFLTLTGKLPAAIAVLVALWPILSYYMKNRTDASPPPPQNGTMPNSRIEALEILGLKDGASEDDIRAAHLRLMKKLHPDSQGSDWLARKINAARDILLK